MYRVWELYSMLPVNLCCDNSMYRVWELYSMLLVNMCCDNSMYRVWELYSMFLCAEVCHSMVKRYTSYEIVLYLAVSVSRTLCLQVLLLLVTTTHS